MDSLHSDRGQAGYSLIELLLAMSLMLVLMGVVFNFARDSFTANAVTMETAEAQEGVRTAHDMISRDLIVAGDGLNGINNIRLPTAFVTNYLSANPVVDPTNNNYVNLALITSDDNVPAGRAVLQTNPAVTVRSAPNGTGTDRLTILEIDPNSNNTPVNVTAFTSNGLTATIPAANINNFSVGDVIFVTTSAGSTFATVTARNTTNNTLTFGSGDAFGLNQPVTGGPINVVTNGGALAASLVRMLMIHYFVDSNGLLIRRVLGLPGVGGLRDSVVCEHVVDLQFRFALNLFNGNGTIVQPVTQLTTAQQQVAVRQVEVTITAETTHPLLRGTRPQVTMTTSTSVRNMQFREALQPGAGG